MDDFQIRQLQSQNFQQSIKPVDSQSASRVTQAPSDYRFGSMTSQRALLNENTSGLAFGRTANNQDIYMMSPYGSIKCNELGYA